MLAHVTSGVREYSIREYVPLSFGRGIQTAFKKRNSLMQQRTIVYANKKKDPEVINPSLWGKIYYSDTQPLESFNVKLSNGEIFYCDKVIRFFPKQRLVAYGLWREKQVVAKIFFHPKHAEVKQKKDWLGIQLLRNNKINTPKILYRGESQCGHFYILIFERILHATTLEQIWKNKSSVTELLALIRNILNELAAQHLRGIVQHDLQLKNFLIDRQNIYFLDGGHIEYNEYIFRKTFAMDLIANFLCQFVSGLEIHFAEFLQYYAKLRNWTLTEKEINKLIFLINKKKERGWKKFGKKIFRNSSGFIYKKIKLLFFVVSRGHINNDLLKLLREPELILQQHDATILKTEKTIQTFRISFNRYEYIIKRFVSYSPFAYLRSKFSLSPAAKEWKAAHQQNFYSTKTTHPVAFIEKKSTFFKSISYYVTELHSNS